MSHVMPLVRVALLLGGVFVASACATGPWARLPHGGSVLVATDEPLTPRTDSLPAQPVVADSGAGELLGGVAHLVANNGRVQSTGMRPVVAPVAAACASIGGRGGAGPLEERGVHRAVEGPVLRSTWLFVGLAFGGDGVLPLLDVGRCGGWLDAGAGSRLARVAPAVTGRDTSVLFTSARATGPAHGSPGIVARMLDRVLGRTTPDDAAPRTAKPRPGGSGER